MVDPVIGIKLTDELDTLTLRRHAQDDDMFTTLSSLVLERRMSGPLADPHPHRPRARVECNLEAAQRGAVGESRVQCGLTVCLDTLGLAGLT